MYQQRNELLAIDDNQVKFVTRQHENEINVVIEQEPHHVTVLDDYTIDPGERLQTSAMVFVRKQNNDCFCSKFHTKMLENSWGVLVCKLLISHR